MIIEGDTAQAEPWAELEEVRTRVYQYAGGADIKIRTMAVDSGYNPNLVYNWVRKREPNEVMAIKGSGSKQAAALVARPKPVDVTVAGRKVVRGAQLWMVVVSMAKSEFYGRLRQKQPTNPAETGYPQGYCHFPEDRDEDWFQQITAEVHAREETESGPRFYWKVTPGRRNESLDCRVYARAAAWVVGIDRWTDDDWQALEDQLLTGEKPKTNERKRDGRLGRIELKGRLDRFR